MVAPVLKSFQAEVSRCLCTQHILATVEESVRPKIQRNYGKVLSLTAAVEAGSVSPPATFFWIRLKAHLA